MSIKTKIITTVVCICCIVSAMVVGILAASQQTFNISGATVSFTSNQIAFDLKYAIMGNVDDNDNVVKPLEYTTQSVGIDGKATPWSIGSLNFDGIGSPIYIDLNVGLHSENISQEVLVSFVKESPIIYTITNGSSIKVSFVEVKQQWRDTSKVGSAPYVNMLDSVTVQDNVCVFNLSDYSDALGLTGGSALEWTTLTKDNLPSGMTKGNGLDNTTSRNGQYTLILKIEPQDGGLNFSDQVIDFNLNFTGVTGVAEDTTE